MLEKELKEYYVDFETAMGKGTGYERQTKRYTGKNQEYLTFFQKLYEKNSFQLVQPQTKPKIPRIIHQIWIGNRPIPKKLQQYQQTWKEQNPDWEYKLWTNKEVQNYSFANRDLKFLFSKSLTLGERVDILRYDILYQYGGIYADCDCICLKPMNAFAYSYDFFAGIFPPMFAEMEIAVFLQNCLVGAKPQHPIIHKVASLIRGNWDNIKHQEDEFYTTITRTFWTLTLAVVSEAGKNNNIDIVMPPSYFFPITPYPIYDFLIRGWQETLIGLFIPEKNPYFSVKEHSFSHHYSHKEWLKDIYSSFTFKHEGWTIFTFKDWLLFFKSKLFATKKQKTIARETFEELLARANS